MGTYRIEWPCCGSVTETEAWEPQECPICAMSNAATQTQWRAIETAPSGEAVLIYYTNALGKGRTIKARYIKRYTEESNYFADEGVDEYDEDNDRYTYVEGWWEMLDNWEEYGFVKVYSGTPTHWMPLPSPPKKD